MRNSFWRNIGGALLTNEEKHVQSRTLIAVRYVGMFQSQRDFTTCDLHQFPSVLLQNKVVEL